MIKQIGLPLRGRPILLITRIITDRIGLHSVLLPLRIFLFNNSWASSFSGCQFVLFSVLRHSAVHSTTVLLPLVGLRSRREKCKNRSVFRVSMSEKRYLPTVVSSNNCTIKYLFFSKAVVKKLNYIKICLYLKLNWLRRDCTLFKL